MMAIKMHPNEVDTDVFLVRRLLAAQFPQWAELPIVPVASAGTDNALFRLGDEMAVRLPRIDWAVGQAEKDQYWLPKLAPLLPLEIPALLEIGLPGEGFPWYWGIYCWREGENATLQAIADPNQTAIDLAEFLIALQRLDPTGGPPANQYSRGAALKLRDAIRVRQLQP